MNTHKTLIIKTGYTETLCNEPYKESNVSLGDVLRTTALLHLYRDKHITWLTDEKAIPLLRHNKYISRILTYNISNVLQLENEIYDTVINLEKHPGICALANKIQAWQKLGFRFDPRTGEAEAYDHSLEALYISRDERKKKDDGKHWLEHLYDMVGAKWKGEGYILGQYEQDKDSVDVETPIGLNFRVGQKFKDKEWPRHYWKSLGSLLKGEGVDFDEQPEETNIEDYIRWIMAHDLIVSSDSLGLHLAMACDKYVVGIFGPTQAKEIQPYHKGKMLQGVTTKDLDPQEVCEAVKELYASQ